MKKLMVILWLCASMQASALEVDGVKFADSIPLENSSLVLNGAGVRSIVFFKMYVIGLYLAEKQASANLIFADNKPKRIALQVVVGEGDTERFLNGFSKGIEKNHTEAQMAVLRERMAAFEQMFAAVKTVKKGDVITFDWLPAEGTRVSLNSAELGRINGEDFYRALLSIWIGNKPVTDSLKKELLGG
jgi:hypothetical protein